MNIACEFVDKEGKSEIIVIDYSKISTVSVVIKDSKYYMFKGFRSKHSEGALFEEIDPPIEFDTLLEKEQ